MMRESLLVYADPTFKEPVAQVDIEILLAEFGEGKNLNSICADNNWPEDEVSVLLHTLNCKFK